MGVPLFSVMEQTSLKENTGESEEIQVTVSVSKDGEFLDDKDGKPMAGRVITLSWTI